MTNDQNDNSKQDWNKLATEALDLWQNHLNALATDPKVKEEVTRFVTPMTQMFSQWTTMMQSGLQGMAGFTPSSEQEGAAATKQADDAAQDPAATAASDVAPTDGASADVQPDATRDTRGVSGPESGLVSTTSSAVTAAPAVTAPVATAPVATATAAEPPVRGRAASSDGPRDLAQLASRLAQLERELDSLRPKNKRTSDNAAATLDAAIDGAVQRVAGTDKGTNSA